MSKGVLIFAYNSKLDYVSIATIAARLVKKYLNLPVTLVTNVTDADYTVFDDVIFRGLDQNEFHRTFWFKGSKEKMPWHNQNRSSAYELSPYDQTLLIDADYLMFNNSLAQLFDTDLEFACFDDVLDISGNGTLAAGARVGTPGIPMQWATVVYFTKCPLAEYVFSMMQTIREQYSYYSELYNFNNVLYRNDFALSIALQALSGYGTKTFNAIPGALITANTGTELLEIRPDNELVFVWTGADKKSHVTKIKNTNIHIMNKRNMSDPGILEQLRKLAND